LDTHLFGLFIKEPPHKLHHLSLDFVVVADKFFTLDRIFTAVDFYHSGDVFSQANRKQHHQKPHCFSLLKM
jgi:hypothetical protein